jgi:hypothetical protein
VVGCGGGGSGVSVRSAVADVGNVDGSAASVFEPLTNQMIATIIRRNASTTALPPITRTVIDGPLRMKADSSPKGVNTAPDVAACGRGGWITNGGDATGGGASP